MSDKQQPTPEQIEQYVAQRKKRILQYKEEIGLLKIEAEYVGLLASIDESTLRRATAQHRLATLLAPDIPEPKKEQKPDTNPE